MNLQHRQDKIKVARKQTPRRQFIMECASWQQCNFYKIDGKVSRYPDTDRIGELVEADNFFEINEWVGLDYDDTLSFFDNYRNLRNIIKFPRLWQFGSGNENSDYADTLYNSKNCYLSVSTAFTTENILYSLECHGNLNTVISSVWVHSNSSNIFQCAGVADSFNIFYSYNIQNSSDIRCSSNLTWCSFCFACDHLTNQSYCINNQQYTKEEYITQLPKLLEDKTNFEHLYHNLNRTTPAMLGCHEVEQWQFASYVNKAHNICLVWW
jgi:hypothetical protein